MEVLVSRKEIRRKERGKKAEQLVRDILDTLPKQRYEVINDIKAKYGNIDHLVISREGAVFLIETKGHWGKVTVDKGKVLLNGKPMKRDPVAQMTRNIQWLRETIKNKLGCSVWIVSILVFPNGHIYSPKGQPVLRLRPVHKMNVIGRGSLRRLIESYTPKTERRMIWNRRNTIMP